MLLAPFPFRSSLGQRLRASPPILSHQWAMRALSSAGGFAYVQLLPLAVEEGRTNSRARQQLSNTLLPRCPPPPRFSPCLCLPGCQSRAERCWRLRAELPQARRAQRGHFPPPQRTFQKHRLLVRGVWRRWRWCDAGGAAATPAGLAGCSRGDWTGIADP